MYINSILSKTHPKDMRGNYTIFDLFSPPLYIKRYLKKQLMTKITIKQKTEHPLKIFSKI